MDYSSYLSATERRTTAAKRDDFHSKSLFLVKNPTMERKKSGPKAAPSQTTSHKLTMGSSVIALSHGNFAMRTNFSERLDSE